MKIIRNALVHSKKSITIDNNYLSTSYQNPRTRTNFEFTIKQDKIDFLFMVML